MNTDLDEKYKSRGLVWPDGTEALSCDPETPGYEMTTATYQPADGRQLTFRFGDER